MAKKKVCYKKKEIEKPMVPKNVIMNPHWQEIEKELDSIRKKNLFRECKVTTGIDFCSNDYLGLAKDDRLKQALLKNVEKSTIGSTASRLIKGHRKDTEIWESIFSKFIQTQASLTVANGFIANLGLLDTIADQKSFIFTDRLNHASILDGIRISGAQKKYYDHLDLDHLERLLEEAILNPANRQRKKIIITETLFSMDGDAPDLKRLIKIKRKYDCVLILDEAHAFGVYGNQGRGMCFEDLTEGEIADIEYRVYTLGKSMGLEGGIIATTMVGRDHLVNRMRSFIFSTAPMPLISSTAIDSLNLVMQGDDKREHLKNISARLREGLKKVGFTLSPSISQIIPVLLSSEKEALEYSKELQSRGFDIRAIRPPTVPTARLRISLNSNITENEIDSLIFNMSEIKNKLI